MIPRYSRPEMVAIWSPETKFRIWFEIEAHACDALAELGVIPVDAARVIWEKGGAATFDVARIDEIEAVTKHDVIAFLTHLAENRRSRRALRAPGHDVIGRAGHDLQHPAGARCRPAACRHGPRSCGAEGAGTRAQGHGSDRPQPRHPCRADHDGSHLRALLRGDGPQPRPPRSGARRSRTGAISGAVGTFANIDPRIEEHVCEKLGLQPEPISTQVIPRDRHAMFFATLGVIASSIENVAIEIRHMQRTEVLEAEEFFSPGQKGSSAMPHKRNPVLTENLTGLSRLVRMAVVPAMENVALWHERDISHSSVERAIGPDATVTLDFALHRLAGVVEKLVIYPDNMMANLNKFRGLVHSQRVLLALTQAGASREDSYRLVQRNAMKVWEQGKDFLEELLGDAEVRALLSEEQLREKFDLGYHTKHVDTIFRRVFG